jgi:hypothetical protein
MLETSFIIGASLLSLFIRDRAPPYPRLPHPRHPLGGYDDDLPSPIMLDPGIAECNWSGSTPLAS